MCPLRDGVDWPRRPQEYSADGGAACGQTATRYGVETITKPQSSYLCQAFDFSGILPGRAGRRLACDSLARRLCRAPTTNGAHHRRAVYLKARRLESAFHA
jgi:hypothetical protein